MKKVKKSPKKRDTNKLAYSIALAATTDQFDKVTEAEKNPAAVALGRLGGLKGGRARAKNLTAEKRTAIAKKAAKARWKKRTKK